MFTQEQLATDPVLKFFAFEHVPHKLQKTSALFAATAKEVIDFVPRNAERTVALRKLLEAKDAAVRASLP